MPFCVPQNGTREGGAATTPLNFEGVFNLFWAIWDIQLIFVISNHRSNDFWVIFSAPHKWCVSNVSFARRGVMQGVPNRNPFRLRGVVLAALNACRQGVTRLQPSLPKTVVSTSLAPYPVVIFFGSAKGCRETAVPLSRKHSIGVKKQDPLEGLGIYL